MSLLCRERALCPFTSIETLPSSLRLTDSYQSTSAVSEAIAAVTGSLGSTHHKTFFRLTLSKCVPAFLRLRMGSHSLPRDVGCGKHIPRPQHFCILCHLGWPGDESCLVFGCQALQGVRDKYCDLFVEHAGTMLKFMWQADLHGICKRRYGMAGSFLRGCKY